MSGGGGHAALALLAGLDGAVLVYFLVVNSVYGVLLLAAALQLRRHALVTRGESRRRLLGSELVPRISMLAPAYNEEATVVESVRALLSLQYPDLEVVVVNDGSGDGTLAVLRAAFELVPVHPIFQRRLETRPLRALYRSRSHPSLVVADKENGGKADALNVGLGLATGELVCAMDADTLIEADALQRIVRPFLASDDVVAAGGTIRVVNDCVVRGGQVRAVRAPRSALAGFQVVEYLRAFLFGRLGWNGLGGNLIVSGAFGLFRRGAVIEAGGYLHGTVGEDIELVVRLRRLGYERGGPHDVAFIPDPVAWTEVPESARVLGRQRDRWHRGLADVLWRHRALLLNPRFGAMGLVVVPYFVFIELLAPVVEAIGLVGLVLGLALGAVNWSFALLFFLAAYGYGLVLSLATLLLEELAYHRYQRASDRLRLAACALLENFGFRQATVLWRLRGLVRYLRGRTDWGVMVRKGHA